MCFRGKNCSEEDFGDQEFSLKRKNSGIKIYTIIELYSTLDCYRLTETLIEFTEYGFKSRRISSAGQNRYYVS
jgi:hypothetical protein